MSRFKITIKRSGNSNGIQFEQGMSVEVITRTNNNPILSNGGQDVVSAFMRIYNIDVKKAGILSTAYMDAVSIP